MFITSNFKFRFNSIGFIFFLKAQETAKLNKNVSSREYNGSLDCAKQLYKKGGMKSLYRGAAITIGRGRIS
jgi:hypothetical protein